MLHETNSTQNLFKLAALAPKIRTPTQLVAFAFACVTTVVLIKGDILFGLAGILAVVLLLLCVFPLKKLIALLPKISSLPLEQQSETFRELAKRIFQVIILIIASLFFFFSMIVATFLFQKTVVGEEARTFHSEFSTLLTQRLFRMEKLVENNGRHLSFESKQYKEYKIVRDRYNEVLNDVINKIDRYFKSSDQEVRWKFRRIRYWFVNLNNCIISTIEGKSSQVPLETSKTVKPFKGDREKWECIKCIPCSSRNLSTSLEALRGAIHDLLHSLNPHV